jgi:hypothetical protein
MDATTPTESTPAPAEPDFAAFDLLVDALARWAAAAPAWPPARPLLCGCSARLAPPWAWVTARSRSAISVISSTGETGAETRVSSPARSRARMKSCVVGNMWRGYSLVGGFWTRSL